MEQRDFAAPRQRYSGYRIDGSVAVLTYALPIQVRVNSSDPVKIESHVVLNRQALEDRIANMAKYASYDLTIERTALAELIQAEEAFEQERAALAEDPRNKEA